MIARSTLALLLATTPLAAHAQDAKDKKPQSPQRSWNLHDALGAPDNLKISGSVRARYETIGNDFRPGLPDNDAVVELQTDIFAEYDTGPVRIGGELLDARVYDDGRRSPVGTGDVNALEPIQAYLGFDLGNVLGKGSATNIDAGRFTMNVGSRRLLARNVFRNTTNAFTGVKLERRGADKSYLIAFYTLPQVRLPDDKASLIENDVKLDRQDFNLTFWGGFYSKPKALGANNIDLFFYALNEDDSRQSATRNRNIYTPGLRIYRDAKPAHFDYEVEGAYQFGNIRTSSSPSAPKVDVSAFFIHGEVGYQFDAAWKPRVAVVYDIASGDKGRGDYNRFDSLFGTRRGDYGPTGIYGALGRNNISSPGVLLQVKPDNRWDGELFYRAAWLESRTDSFASTKVVDPAGRSGSFAGQQIAARARYWIVPKLLRLETGGAVLFNGHFLDDAPNANRYGDPIYGYFALEADF